MLFCKTCDISFVAYVISNLIHGIFDFLCGKILEQQ